MEVEVPTWAVPSSSTFSFSFQAPVVQKLDQLSSEKKSLSSGSVLGKTNCFMWLSRSKGE